MIAENSSNEALLYIQKVPSLESQPGSRLSSLWPGLTFFGAYKTRLYPYLPHFFKSPINRCHIEVEVNLRPTVSRPVCLGVRHASGTRDQCFFLLEIFFRQLRVYYFVAPSLTRGRACNLLYNCFWALPEQSLLD
jgi:hypothetical protein